MLFGMDIVVLSQPRLAHLVCMDTTVCYVIDPVECCSSGIIALSLTLISTEFCYNTRYPAENGRKPGSPWSLRQTGIYQQVNLQSKESVWILLQSSAKVLRRVEGILASPSDEAHPMRAHVILLFTMAADWHKYISYLQKQLETLVGALK